MNEAESDTTDLSRGHLLRRLIDASVALCSFAISGTGGPNFRMQRRQELAESIR